LVDFNIEGQGRIYTIEWQRNNNNDDNIVVDNTCPKDYSGPSSGSRSASTIATIYNGSSCIERWSESRVAIGVLLNQNVGLKVAKYFGSDVFIGQVTDVFATDVENTTLSINNNVEDVLYHIKYEDGDSEDFDQTELEEGVALYSLVRKGKKRKNNDGGRNVRLTSRSLKTTREKKVHRFDDNLDDVQRRNATPASYSFGVMCDKSTPIHTLILGTHPARKSLNENRYFANPTNAFWWIAGDCLGFRRDKGEKAAGGPMKICADLRYDESRVIPYEKQVNILCQHGFALWDIIASCQRKGSLDGAIKNDTPNDIRSFVEQNPTIKRIVLANGKSGLAIFNRHFGEWWESGKIILDNSEATSRSQASVSNSKMVQLVETENASVIKCICAVSVSPAAATITYKEKRDFWDVHVYAPGLELQRHLAATKELSPHSCSSLGSKKTITFPSSTEPIDSTANESHEHDELNKKESEQATSAIDT